MKTTTKIVTPLFATLFALISLVAPGSILLAQAVPPAISQAGSATTASKAQVRAQATVQATASATAQAKAPPKAQAKMVDGWIIKQSAKLFGDQVLVVSPIGIKSSNPKTSICLVMTPPFELATVYNDQNQSIFQTPVKSLRCPMQKTFALFNSWVLGEQPMIKVGTGTLKGFNVVKYETTKAYSARQANLRKIDKTPSSNPMILDSQSTDDFHLAPGAGLGLCRLYGLPLVPGIPLEVLCKDSDLTPSFFLQSQKCTKTKVSAGDFALPIGYSRIKSIEEINRSNVTPDAMQLFGK